MPDIARVQALVERARTLPRSERLDFVQREAAGDAAVAAAVLALLADGSSQSDPKVSLAGDDSQGGESSVLDDIKNREQSSSRYDRVGEIARGGMGAVSRVFDRDLRRYLAMKVMLGDDSARIARFLEEAQVSGQLDHPNIVPVHELGLDPDGRVFFTMKLVKGETLRQVFEKVATGEDGWNVTRALSVILRVCEAMAFAHAKGVLHRDLKPANVMVGRFGEVYVMDWGLARVMGRQDKRDIRIQPDGSLSVVHTERRERVSSAPDSPLITMDGAVVGTPAYMPPEQAEGLLDAVGPHSDVYAVGALLYHLFSGREPYDERGLNRSGRHILNRVIAGPPQPLHELARDIPAELLAIQEKAMARSIADRYPSMDALKDDLRAYLEHRVVSAYETGAIAELKKWVERNRSLAAAAAILVLVLAGASVLFAAKNREIQAKNVEISRQKAEAEDSRTRADRERDQVLRLADVKRLEQLRNRQEALWPSFPKKVPGIEQWLADAKALLERLAEHRKTRDALREDALPYTEADAARDRETHPGAGRLADLRGQKAKLEATNPKSANGKSTRDAALAKTNEQIEALEKAVGTRRTYVFSEATDQWQCDVLSELVSGLEALAAPDEFGLTIAALERRLDDARTIESDSIGKYGNEWDETIAAVAADPKYHGLRLTKRIGLVPIGRDGDSGLFEFWHVRSGARPERDESGKIKVTGEMGLVFVLVPGGTFFQGAQGKDEQGRNYDPQAKPEEANSSHEPVEVTLDACFISKYEWTQGQWQRLFGRNPSNYRPGSTLEGQKVTLAHPVSSVSWTDCDDATRRVGFALPTEAQWERAARGGSDTPWFFGGDKAELGKYGNTADKSAKKSTPWNCDMDVDDGYVFFAPVGSFLPNAFGLYDTIGNQYEWCRDGFTSYDEHARAGDGERVVRDPGERVPRGGSFDDPAFTSRSALRYGLDPGAQYNASGVRPTLPLLDP